MPRIVIAGGGIAGLEALVALRAHLGPQAEIQLLEANAELVERQRAVVEPFDAGSPRRFDLGRIAADHHSCVRGRPERLPALAGRQAASAWSRVRGLSRGARKGGAHGAPPFRLDTPAPCCGVLNAQPRGE
jgi:hypothetical protein